MQKITTSVLSLVLVLFVLTGLALTGDMTHIPDRDFNTLKAAGNRNPTGIWSDGTTMWVADASDDKIYAYNMRTRARDRGRDFNTLAASKTTLQGSGLTGRPCGWWTRADGRIYAYNMRTKSP